MTERTVGWIQKLLLPFLLAFLVGGIALNERVREIKATQVRVLEAKADKAYVDAKFDAILRETADIKQLLRDHANADRGLRR